MFHSAITTIRLLFVQSSIMIRCLYIVLGSDLTLYFATIYVRYKEQTPEHPKGQTKI